jgi:hypothetical protein
MGRASNAALALEAGDDPLGLDLLDGLDPRWWATYCDIEDERIRRDPALQGFELALCERSMPYFVQRYFWIQDKVSGRATRLLPNPLQLKYERERLDENVKLKARKMGASTWIDARMFHRARFRRHQNGIIAAHLADSTAELFGRIQFALEYLPPWLATRMERSTTTMIKFAEMGSKIRVLTAGGQGEIGRGGDTDMLHLSEAAFFPDLGKVLTGAGESMRPGAWLDIESTPNGFEEFRDQYEAAKLPGSRRRAHFYAWWVHPANRVPEERPLSAMDLSEEERGLVEAVGLDAQQVAWRRQKKAELRGKFLQEHPENDATCFLTSGDPRFDNVSIARLIPVVESRVFALDIDAVAPVGDVTGRRLRKHAEHLQLWVPPIKDRRYLIGADVAGGGGGDADFSYATILDVTERAKVEQVGMYRSNAIKPGSFGRLLASLGRFYNDATLAPETNNHGHATLYAIQQDGYWNLYYHVDLVTGKQRDDPGFPTEGGALGTRAQILDMLNECLMLGAMVIRDAQFLRECLTFQSGDEIDTPAARKQPRRRKIKRDGVMANAIGYYCAMRSLPAVA